MAIRGVFRNLVVDSGSPQLTIPAGAALAVYSAAGARILQWTQASANYPGKWSQLAVIPADTPYVTSTFASGALLAIESYGLEVYYEIGTAPVVQVTAGMSGNAVTPSAVNTSATLTVANLMGQVITSSTVAAVTGTLMTGTVLDAGATFNVNDWFEFSVINTGGTNAFTVATATGWTLVGSMTVALSTSGRFRAYKTAANTFTMYRMS